MANLRFRLPRDPKTQSRRRTASTGAFGVPGAGGKSKPRYASSHSAETPLTKNSQFAGAGAGVVFTQPMFFSPMHTPQNWQIASKRREIYQWARFYYENECKVAAGVDFYANFPMNGFKLECPDSKILEYFEEIVEDLELNEWLNYISHEYYLLGDVFPFLEIDCPVCDGKSIDPETEERCNHPDGTFSSIRIMNPDSIEVQDNVLADDPVIAMLPDEELKLIIQRKQPKQIYDALPDWLIELVSEGHPIPLSNRSVSHIKHNASPYGTYGTSMIRRLFTVLAYKTKLMTANWIVAERLILPVRVVMIGDKDRPATEDDIQDAVNQLAAVSNDPNLTIVTHHAFKYEWYGAQGKIVQLNNEMEAIGKELLDGMMLNQAILNGEMAGYNSAQVGVEILIRRLENWRTKLKNWVEKKIFLPIAMMRGFIDEKKSKRQGRPVYVYPKIKWNELQLRDNTNRVQLLLQVYDKGGVAMQTICEELGLDYDSEVEKLRQEQMIASASGLMSGGQQPPGGMPGAPPGAGGGPGMPGPGAGPSGAGPDGAGGGPPGMGGPPGGGPMAPGMMPPGGGPMASAPPTIKKGGNKPEEMQPPPNKMLKLTKLEATVYNELTKMNLPYQLFGQYTINMPGQKQPFVLDFAYPELGVGIEADGAIWHERADLKQRDQERDEKLANVGWRILRFSETAVYEHMDAVRDIIAKSIQDASKDMKKAANLDAETMRKFAMARSIPSLLPPLIHPNDRVKLVRTAAATNAALEEMGIELEEYGDEIGYVIKIGY